MANLSYPEIAEITNASLPPASLDALKSMRNRMCESSSQSGFKLQSHQRFLRRILSPDSPLRNLLMIHGTGVGKTCTAIQVAEEYILRPEFQDKRVMVVASRAVEENFRTQIFDMNRVNIDVIAGTLESKQCTGRRYLDMLMRIESEPKNWNNPDTRDKLETIANRIINEFYEFTAYASFGNMINEKLGGTKADVDEEWVHANFDNRLVIIDEAHNIRESKDSEGIKGVTQGLEKLVKIANGMVLVFLTATPMFDTFDEIVFYMNLFLWNDRKQGEKESVKVTDFFNPDATLKAGEAGDKFRNWCQDYVSYVRGENPFTFPFRLPPPKTVSTESIRTGFTGKAIGDNERIQYLSLVESVASGMQKSVLTGEERVDDDEKKRALMQSTVSVLPENKTFNQSFKLTGKQYEYANDAFLTPEQLPNYSSKFVTILKSIQESKGVVLVYSNFATMGSRLFAMALEEHGFTPAVGATLLAKPEYEGASKGKYILLTSKASDAEISDLLSRVKSPKNRDGSQIRVIVSSPIVSEGVDFRFVRQIHVIDPWWNMSRIEQVVGRGLRTCSHQLLPFDEQNCTVYLHIVRSGDNKECFDEYTYRTKVEPKATKIARIRKVIAESAMDCPLQNQINTLPTDWKNLEVPQVRAEGAGPVTYRLYSMMAPTFDDTPDVAQCIVKPTIADPEHVRPLSTYLDVRDELLTKLASLMIDKPIWDRDELLSALRPFTKDVVIYNLQQAITSGFRFKDSFGRPSVLESKGDLYTLSPIGSPNGTLVERTTKPGAKGTVAIPRIEVEEEEVEVAANLLDIKRDAYAFPSDAKTRFSEETLNGYIFDHEFTDSEKRAFLKTKPEGLPFADRLYVPGTEYIVLGEGKFEPADQPIGSDLTNFKEWNSALLAKFIENKETLFGSVSSTGKFTIVKMNIKDDGTVTRKMDKSFKKFEPIACGTGDNDNTTVHAFAKFVDSKGVGAPGKFKNATELCKYAELLAREENNCVWFTPEELSVLYGNAENKKAFTAAFKK